MRLPSLIATAALTAIAALAACQVFPSAEGTAETPGASAAPILLTGKWLFTDVAGQKIEMNSERPAYLEFSADNRVSGSGGCNRVAGEYRLADGRIHFSRLLATKMACLDMRTEDVLLAALPTVASYTLSESGNILTFYNGDGAPVAAFHRDAGDGKH